MVGNQDLVSDNDVSDGEQNAITDHRRRRGDYMLEVFAVYINDNEDIGNNEVYGTITFCNGDSSFEPIEPLYNRQTEGAESITSINDIDHNLASRVNDYIHICERIVYDPEEKDWESIYNPDRSILLTGPGKHELHDMIFSIVFALMDRNHSELCIGSIFWPNVPYHMDLSDYQDEPCYLHIGSATMFFAMYSNAMAAKIEVTLMDTGNGEDSIDLYGRVTARNSDFNFEVYERVLFRKKADEKINIKRRQLVPLSRSLVVVPLDSKLILQAELHDYSKSCQIINGTAKFRPPHNATISLNGSAIVNDARQVTTIQKDIEGGIGEIQVKVTWL